ncbi:MAG: hypothetical protein PW734_08070 [Verrucomicrobium sp.]|nr:hypothetical protein [Verrucomicrobium sp.]
MRTRKASLFYLTVLACCAAPLFAQPVKIYQDAALNEQPAAATPPAPAAPASEPAVEPPSKEARKMAQKEEMRRAQQVMEASQAINAGDIFYQAGEYAKASERYTYAYGIFQTTGLSSTGEQRAKSGLVQVKIKQAEVASQAGDFAHATALLDEAEKLDPTRKPDIDKDRAQIKEAQVKLAKQRVNPESTTNNPVLTPDFKDKVAAVQRLLFEGDRFFETGQYDKANDRYRQALVIDPYNKAARTKLDRLERYETRAADKARETTRTAALYDVERRWTEREQPVEKAALGEVAPAQESNIARLSKKLSAIKIDSISFVSQPIDEAVRFLAAKAKQADPTGEGINFVLKVSPTGGLRLQGRGSGRPRRPHRHPKPEQCLPGRGSPRPHPADEPEV